MTHAHFYLPAHAWGEGEVRLTGDEAKHCAQVTRHHVSDEVVVFDGAGRKARARIQALDKAEVRLAVLETQQMPLPAHPVTLVQAVTKGDTFEWILEKAVELGVQRLVPVITDRTIVRIDPREAAKKHQKWQRVVMEACKQCGQPWLPEVVMPCHLEAALDRAGDTALRLVASLHPGARPLKSLLPGPLAAGSGCAVMIGPEGDFTPRELELLQARGWQEWSLGPLVLRSETAAICALSILGYETLSPPANVPGNQ